MKVLIGEDNRASRTLLEKSMEVLNNEAGTAENGDEVIERLEENGFDIVFLNWKLSGKDEMTLAKEIKNDREGKKPYIIMMAPEEKEDVDLVEALKLGADDFLVKPLNRDLIRSRMKKARISLEVEEGELMVEPLEDLRKDHELLRRMANILEVVHFRIKDEVPRKVMNWIGSSSLTLDHEIHHKKEKYYLISFIENAMNEQGEKPNSRLFSRASLKQVEEEHDQLENMVNDIQEMVERSRDKDVDPDRVRDMLREYKELIREHLSREEKYLFPLSAKYMDEETSKELKSRFNKVEEKAGYDRIEQLEKQIAKGEETLYLK